MKKYAVVGTGTRCSYAFLKPIVDDFADCAELCGLYDTNRMRAEYCNKYIESNIPVFDSFDEMLETTKPDCVIVTCKDCAHAEYIVKALDFGCDVLSEKPLTTTPEMANAIVEAEKRSGKKVTVTFNCRFLSEFTRVKELIMAGEIGEIYSVHLEWMLDLKHGASYFRRWHRQRKNSGSLLVHKSSHHFDVVNWLLEQDPVAVNAFGATRFYGPTREERGEHCSTCKYAKTCEFYVGDFYIDNFSKPNEFVDEMYVKASKIDGYVPDMCVFSDEIDIEDTVSVSVNYSGGAVLSYSLTAHSPYEGFRLKINGSKGRIELDSNLPDRPGFESKGSAILKLFNRRGECVTYGLPKNPSGGHGGADPKMRDFIFRGYKEDPLNQMADTHAGLMSIGIGMAATKSMDEKRQITIKELYETK